MALADYFYRDSNYTLLSVAQCAQADKLSATAGVSGLNLMENAGKAVAKLIAETITNPTVLKGPIVILCGPGNNGGDGFVAARYLEGWGYPTQLYLLGDVTDIKGDAKIMADRWRGEMPPMTPECTKNASVIVDAIFGAGISREISGVAAQVIDSANNVDALKVSIDLPSGLNGDTGQCLGVCFQADTTVTFFTKKPGHLLIPGRFLCGGHDHIHVVDIGIEDTVLPDIKSKQSENVPEMWGATYPQPSPVGHKYNRGHVLVLGGKEPALGASRLAALAALRAGAGLVSMACPSESYGVQATALTDVMVRRFDSAFGFLGIVEDPRLNVITIGPGAGVSEKTVELVRGVLERGKALVLDADGISSFAGRSNMLENHSSALILTPHEGEFERLFPDLVSDMSRIEAATVAANRLQAVIVLKGPDTIIAGPDGHVAINSNAPTWLSVGGTGDILSGIIASLLAQGMPAFEASCAGVWFHSEAANISGKGLIASDLLESMRQVIP